MNYGLSYHNSFLDALPNKDGIRTLTTNQFDQLHHSHVLSHPPDAALFPFLHGLEGENEVQNIFFASQGQQCFKNPDGIKLKKAKVPRYRALTWVVCEDDIEEENEYQLEREGSEESYDDEGDGLTNDDDGSESSDSAPLSCSYNSSASMQVDIAHPDEDEFHREYPEIPGEEKHMHPVQRRAGGYSSSSSESEEIQVLDTSTPPKSQCSTPSSSSNSRPSSRPSGGSRLPPPILTSTFRATELLRRVAVPKHSLPVPGSSCGLGSGSRAKGQSQAVSYNNAGTGSDIVDYICASLGADASGVEDTSDNLRESSQPYDDGNSDDEWEFHPLNVPEGISLRNFGIQVPILSTLSDIVIYSPTSSGAARSRNAQRLARRFRGALERKFRDRVGGKVEVKGKEEELPLKYNVFILDATADEIRRDLSHLVRRPWGDGEVPGASSSSSSSSSAGSCSTSASGPFGDKDKDKDGDVQMTELDSESPLTHLPPNTVNFSQRERDEMRDLTRASEIITVWPRGEHQREEVESPVDEDELDNDEDEEEFDEDVDTEEDEEQEGEGEDEEVDISTLKTHWDPSIGQVFLGNANDVPLPVGDGTEWELLAGREGFNRDEETEVDVWADLDWESVLTRTRSRSDETKSSRRAKTTKSKRNGNVYTPTYALPEGNTPSQGYGYDICIECHDQAPFPSGAHFKAAEEKIEILEEGWKRRVLSERERLRGLGLEGHSNLEEVDTFPPRPSPHPNSVIHLPMPGSPVSSSASVNAIMALVGFLRRCVEPKGPVRIPGSQTYSDAKKGQEKEIRGGRRWSSVSSLMSSFSSPFGSSSTSTAAPSSPRQRSFTSSSLPSRHHHLCSSSSQCSCKTQTQSTRPGWSRPLKILIYSSDGYTESSILALCLLMALKQVDLPRAYLELQVEKRRSFFVYQMDLGVLRRVEDALVLEREREAKEREAMEKREREKKDRERREREARYSFVNGSGHLDLGNGLSPGQGPGMSKGGRNRTRPAAKSVSFARGHAALSSSSTSYISSYPGPLPVLGEREWEREQRSATMPPMSCSLPTLQSSESVLDSSMSNGNIGSIGGGNNIGQRRRPRAKTSPWLPSYSLFGGDHQNWFNDPRFDGSFPSRVLPFLYLGNLNHASNVYMLQALGITHVVSVGECALIPPHNVQNGRNSGSNNNNNNSNHYSHGHRTPGKSPDHHQGSLWIEEREGRIKVLDIQGVCDDGIDTLEPQLEPICDWIDQARQEGGQVLVHCRVGVSRSATVTIAYVMKHLSLPLVDAYLIVRSRRLSVLIQPNMRLLYNLLGWEIKLAKERAGGDERKLRHELSSALTWPYLAKEVHKLNEKYLQ